MSSYYRSKNCLQPVYGQSPVTNQSPKNVEEKEEAKEDAKDKYENTTVASSDANTNGSSFRERLNINDFLTMLSPTTRKQTIGNITEKEVVSEETSIKRNANNDSYYNRIAKNTKTKAKKKRKKRKRITMPKSYCITPPVSNEVNDAVENFLSYCGPCKYDLRTRSKHLLNRSSDASSIENDLAVNQMKYGLEDNLSGKDCLGSRNSKLEKVEIIPVVSHGEILSNMSQEMKGEQVSQERYVVQSSHQNYIQNHVEKIKNSDKTMSNESSQVAILCQASHEEIGGENSEREVVVEGFQKNGISQDSVSQSSMTDEQTKVLREEYTHHVLEQTSQKNVTDQVAQKEFFDRMSVEEIADLNSKKEIDKENIIVEEEIKHAEFLYGTSAVTAEKQLRSTKVDLMVDFIREKVVPTINMTPVRKITVSIF